GPTTSWYEKGNELLKSGKWEEALSVWEQGQKQLSQHRLPDPRIGISYIRLVAQKKLKENYSQAIEYYLWGIKAKPDEKYSSNFEDEIERLHPIASEEKVNQWSKMLKQQNPKLGRSIASFWEELDPVLSTEMNERIIEHWLRIDYSRKHFTRNEDTVYGTDERGNIYVKYGKPARTYSRSLRFDQTQALQTAKSLLEKEINDRGESGIQPLDTDKEGGGYVFVENTGLARHLIKLAKQLHGQPEISVWVYDQLPNPLWNSTVFIFGRRHNGPFQMLTSLEQLLDGAMYQKLRYQGGRYETPPVFLAQQQLYESVRDIAPVFNDRFSEMQQQIFLSNQDVTLWDAIDIRDKSFITFNQSYLSSTKEASLFENIIPELPTRVAQYRLINPQTNQPYTFTSVFAYPLKAAVADVLEDYSKNKYFNISTVLQAEPIGLEGNHQLKKTLYDLDNLDEDAPVVTVFSTSQIKAGGRVYISSELSRPEKITDFRGLKTHIKAINKLDIATPEPLNVNTNQLEMSDLIIGYSSAIHQAHIPFKITADNTIPENENLKIMFEVYHLEKNSPGITSVDIDYSVKRDEGFFKRIFSSNENRVGLSLNFETMDTSLSEVLEVDTQNFSPGDYELTLVANGISGQSVKRTIKFTISE
ncbi:MAG TPA: GWxTD domain-containing protein, partial [Bacteroidales bacterium]|nr:GWxTD domain-containing protein [Bacteroidales bacterium]